MELYQLRAFVAVARSGQLARAAEQLHLTQSALSKQIKGLEDTLMLSLFERQPGGMQLSGAGRRLLPLAAQALQAAQAVGQQAAAIRGDVSGLLRIGTIIDPASLRLGPLLAALLGAHPHLDVRLVHGISGDVLRQLRERAVEACFHLGAVDDAEIGSELLCMEHYLVVAPRAWQARVQGASWEDLARLPWLATPPGSSQHGLVARLFAERGLSYGTVVEADQESSMAHLVRSGVALGLMRERMAAEALASGEMVAWDGARVPCPLQLLYRRADESGPVLQVLRGALRSVWA